MSPGHARKAPAGREGPRETKTGATALFERTHARLREICLAFPQSSEKLAWGHPTFRAGKRIFVSLGVYGGEVCFGFKPDEETYRELVGDPRCFVPPYVGHLGWLSMRVRGPLDPREARALCEQSYRQVAQARMLRELDGAAPRTRGRAAKGAAPARRRKGPKA
jgi:predicted DNA-binding protein (MmcQ/YjbR family)